MSDQVTFCNWLSNLFPDDEVLFKDPELTREAFRTLVLEFARRISGTPAKRIALSFQKPHLFLAAFTACLFLNRHPVLFPARKVNFERLSSKFDLLISSEELCGTDSLVLEGNFLCAQKTNEDLLISPEAAFSLFTSGSSGEPKEIIKTVSQMNREAQITSRLFKDVCGKRPFLASVELCHMYGLTFAVWLPIALRSSLYSRLLKASDMISQVAEPINLITSPTFLRTLDSELRWPKIGFLLSAGGRLEDRDLKNARLVAGRNVFEIYGSTETGVIATRHHTTETNTLPWTLAPGIRIRIIEDSAFLSSPLLTEDFELEDRITLKSDFEFELAGRKDRIIKIGERRFSLTDIKKHVESVCQRECYLVPVQRPNRILLGAVLKGAPFTLSEIGSWRKALLQKIEPLAIPRLWRHVPHFEMNAQGKVEVCTLIDLFEEPKGALNE